MRLKLILIITAIISFACTNPNKDIVNTEQDYQIIPKPVKFEIINGRFVVDSNTKITGDQSLQNEGDFLAEMLSTVTNVDVPFGTNNKGNIILKLDNSIENEEGYTLFVTYDKIIISGKNAKGVFYGIQTLRQLMPRRN